MRENSNGINVVRTFVYPAANRGFFKRILSYVSFMASACLLGPFWIRKPDVVVATSPQFFVAIAGWVLSRIKGVPFIFEVRDLWPASITAVDAMREGFFLRVLEAIEMALYHAAAKVIVVTDATKHVLVDRGIPADKVAVVENGVDLAAFSVASSEEVIRRRLRLDGKFVVSYIGTHGMAHSLHTVLECAAKLQGVPEIYFLLVGDGAEKPNLLALQEKLGLQNVSFLPEQPREVVPSLLAASHVCLVPLRKAELFKTVVPSKIFGIMAAAKPILLSVDGEARSIVEQVGAGVFVPPEDPEAMAATIRQLKASPAKRAAMGAAGRRYVETRMNRSRWARQYETILARVSRS